MPKTAINCYLCQRDTYGENGHAHPMQITHFSLLFEIPTKNKLATAFFYAKTNNIYKRPI
jgi:hypothetical protein